MLLRLFTVLALGSPALAQGVGTPLPRVELQGFAQTEATSLDDFYGRAVLLEFFAHW